MLVWLISLVAALLYSQYELMRVVHYQCCCPKFYCAGGLGISLHMFRKTAIIIYREFQLWTQWVMGEAIKATHVDIQNHLYKTFLVYLFYIKQWQSFRSRLKSSDGASLHSASSPLHHWSLIASLKHLVANDNLVTKNFAVWPKYLDGILMKHQIAFRRQ